MCAWTMLTEFNCQSAICMKNVIVFYYIHTILHTLFNACHVCMWSCLFHLCFEMYAEVALPELFEEPHQPVLNFDHLKTCGTGPEIMH